MEKETFIKEVPRPYLVEENKGEFQINGLVSQGDPLGLTVAVFKGPHAEQWGQLLAEKLTADA